MSPFTFEAETGEIGVGQHDVEIVEAVPGVNKTSGNENLRVSFEARDGTQLTDWWTKSPPARWRWEQLWFSAGLDFPVAGGTVDEKDLIGRRVHIDVIEDAYQGQTRRKIKDVSVPIDADVPIDAPEPEPTSSEDDSEVPF